MESNKNIHSCHLGPEISAEQVIAEHFFLYLLEGEMRVYDGMNSHTLKPGDYCIARKNYLLRYTKYSNDMRFKKILITFDEDFLRYFLTRHPGPEKTKELKGSVFLGQPGSMIKNFIHSLEPYYNGDQVIEEAFADLKREELLMVLLKSDNRLENLFFNFACPERIDLEQFMNRNFRFNVKLERFAFLTGRSLSTFKRDFRKTFGSNPGSWILQKRLNEAHYLIKNERRKPGEIYLELGFEDFSHFCFAFRKHFGVSPTAVH